MADEKIIIGKDTLYPLNGILSVPEGSEGPWPAAVLVQGSGSTNMDEQIMKNRPFRDLANGLSAKGIAVIRYDKRSYIYGRKLVKDTSFTVFDETIDDAIKASEMLKTDPRIDPERVFIIGHSMGGMLAPQIDEMGGGFAGYIIMAGTPRKLEVVLFEQIDETLKTAKGLNRVIMKSVEKKLNKKLSGIYEMSDEKAKTIKVMGGTTAYYFKNMGENDAPSYLERTTKPMLIMQGAKDAQVSVERDFDVYKELLAGRDNVKFNLYPDLNHLFMKSAYGTLKMLKKEYKIQSTVEEEVISDIADWIVPLRT
jgi:dienelactone hydrolase